MIILDSQKTDYEVAIFYIFDPVNKRDIVSKFLSAYGSNKYLQALNMYFNMDDESVLFLYNLNKYKGNVHKLCLHSKLFKEEIISKIKEERLFKTFKSSIHNINNINNELESLLYAIICDKFQESVDEYNSLMSENDPGRLIKDNVYSYNDAFNLFPNSIFGVNYSYLNDDFLKDVDISRINIYQSYYDDKKSLRKIIRLNSDELIPNAIKIILSEGLLINNIDYIIDYKDYIKDSFKYLDDNDNYYLCKLVESLLKKGALSILENQYRVSMQINTSKWNNTHTDILRYAKTISVDNLIKVTDFTDEVRLNKMLENFNLLLELNKTVSFYRKDDMISLLNSFNELYKLDVYQEIIDTINKLDIIYDINEYENDPYRIYGLSLVD